MGAFKISPSLGIEAVARLIPINLHLQKLSGRLQLRAHSLPLNHILHFLMENKSNTLSQQHSLLLNSLTKYQHELIKGHLVNMDNYFNEVFPSFVLRLMPPGDSMDMGKGYDDMIGCATCSLSQCLMQKMLLPCFILVVSSCFNPCVCLIVGLWTRISSIDTFMYPYTLPILHSPYPFSSLCLSCNLIKWVCFDIEFTTVIAISYPEDSESSIIKPILRASHQESGTGSGWSLLIRRYCIGLV